MKKREDRVINIKKVIKYILRHYIMVLICFVIGLVSLVGICFLKNRNNKMVNAEKKNMEQIYDELTDEEKVDVSYAIYCYEMVMTLEKYINSDVLMQIKPYNTKRIVTHYIIELEEDGLNEDERKEKIDNLLSLYSNYIMFGGMAEDVMERLETSSDISTEEIQELLYVSYDTVSTERTGSSASFVAGNYGADVVPDLSEKIFDSIENYEKQADKVANHKLISVETFESDQRYDWIYNAQKNAYSERTSMNDRLNAAVAKLSGDASIYYDEYIKHLDGTEQEIDNISSDAGVETSISKRTLIKYAMVGGLLGVVGACGLLLIMFMFSKYIVSEDDYVATMGLRYIRKIRATDSEVDLSFAVAKINNICNNENVKDVALLSSNYEQVANKIKDELVTMLSNQNIKIECLNDIIINCETMNKLFEIQNCIFVEKIGVSKYNDVYDLVEFCEDNNINILGVLDIE